MINQTQHMQPLEVTDRVLNNTWYTQLSAGLCYGWVPMCGEFYAQVSDKSLSNFNLSFNDLC